MDSKKLKEYLPLPLIAGIILISYSVLFLGGYDSLEEKENAENARIYKQAITTKNISMCDGFKSSGINPRIIFYKANCVCDIIELSTDEEALCLSAEDYCTKVWCYSCYAIKYSDYRICEKSPDKDHCYSELCLSTMTPFPDALEQESCKRINDTVTKSIIHDVVEHYGNLRYFDGCGMFNRYMGQQNQTFYFATSNASGGANISYETRILNSSTN